MKKVLSFALIALTMGFVFVSCDKDNDEVKTYTLSLNLDKADSVYVGTDLSNPLGYYYRQDISIDNFVLTHSFSGWGFGEGFTFTNCSDKNTPGYSNLSAITGNGVKTNTYFTVNTGGVAYPDGLVAGITFKDGKAYNAQDCYVTNSTYAYLAIKDQNDGNQTPLVSPWTDNSTFNLIIRGYNGNEKTDSVIVALAQGTNNILNTWQQVDLKKLGKVTKIEFVTTSTDPMTPSYFCLDQLTVTE